MVASKGWITFVSGLKDKVEGISCFSIGGDRNGSSVSSGSIYGHIFCVAT